MYKQEENMDMYILTENNSASFDMTMNELTPYIDQALESNLMLSPPSISEETLDAATKYEVMDFIPVSPQGPPDRNVMAGDVDFQVEISASDTNRRKYLYSDRLNRIYVDMLVSFPVSFRWLAAKGPVPAYVRACTVFSDESQREKRVERCTQHTHDSTNSALSPEIVKNVLHSSREVGTAGVYYCGVVPRADCWYSVLVEVPPSGNGAHAYQFVCKNSCCSGINRRAIDVIFTLEDASGRVYGRQTVGARVCSCPRRDMLRDENADETRHKRRVAHHTTPRPTTPPTKKIKIEVTEDVDDNLVILPPIQVVGSRAVISGLQVMLNMCEQAAALRGGRGGERYSASIAALTAAIEQLKPRNQPNT